MCFDQIIYICLLINLVYYAVVLGIPLAILVFILRAIARPAAPPPTPESDRLRELAERHGLLYAELYSAGGALIGRAGERSNLPYGGLHKRLLGDAEARWATRASLEHPAQPFAHFQQGELFCLAALTRCGDLVGLFWLARGDPAQDKALSEAIVEDALATLE